MRHQKSGRKFGRNTSHRRAMFRALAGNLVLHEKIVTTDAKAKELRRVVERLITKAGRLGDNLTVDLGKLKDEQRSNVAAARMHAQRLVASFLPHRLTKITEEGPEEVDLVHKLFHEITPRYLGRIAEGKGGGYTRIIKLGHRRGDNAPMSMIELVGGSDDSANETNKKKPKATSETSTKKSGESAAQSE